MIINNPVKKKKYLEKYKIQDLFSTLVDPYLEVHSYKKGEYICRELDTLANLYFLVEGRAKMYQTHRNGKISLVHFYSCGSILGEIELLGVTKTAHSVQAMVDTICIQLPLYNCKEEILNDPKFLREIARHLGFKMLRDTENLIASQAYTLETRLAAFILFSSTNSLYEEKHTEVSQYLGVSYRHLVRVISDFCKRKLLEKEGNVYRIIGLDKLQEIADEISMD
jgi:CRP/FNR family putative post-exponential-phase nitrogen-starvation transcriptional regulator